MRRTIDETRSLLLGVGVRQLHERGLFVAVTHIRLAALSLRTLSGAVPELAEASQERHRESMAAFEVLYEALLAHYRRRVRPPFEISAVSHALAALTEGFAMQSMTGIDHLMYELDDRGQGVGMEWSLLGVAVEALVERLTEPIQPDG